VQTLERKAMAEWFTGTCASKTASTFVESRDLIVKLFRDSPNRHLTATECRRHLAIDVCAVLRLHAFLEHWGLINYNINTSQRPVARGPMDSTGLPVLIALPNGTLVPKDVLSAGGVVEGGSAATKAKNVVPSSHAGTHPNIFHTGAADPVVYEAQIRCTVTGDVCTADRYHCVQKPDLVISPAAWASEQWPGRHSQKISSLFNLLSKMNIELTAENFCQLAITALTLCVCAGGRRRLMRPPALLV